MQSLTLVIVGGGPAGLSTALHLVQIDPSWSGRLVVIEKAVHPRHKLCGGGVTRLGLEMLRDLGFALPLPLPQAQVDDVRLVYGKRCVHVRGQPKFVVFQRSELDAFLAAEARRRGVSILQNEKVESIDLDQIGVIVHTSRGAHSAQAVVGADGSKGISRRLLDGAKAPTRIARLLEVITPAPASAPHFQDRFALFDFTPVHQDLQGYFWDFPSQVEGQPSFNRGVYDSRCAQSRPRAGLPRLLHAALTALREDPSSIAIEGHPIHRFSLRNRFAIPRLLLVGDAAGAEPLFGEGIAPAIGYGKVAAQAIQAAFNRGDYSFDDYRTRLFRSPIGRYLMLRWFIAWWSYRLCRTPGFMPFIWWLGYFLATYWPKEPALVIGQK